MKDQLFFQSGALGEENNFSSQLFSAHCSMLSMRAEDREPVRCESKTGVQHPSAVPLEATAPAMAISLQQAHPFFQLITTLLYLP